MGTKYSLVEGIIPLSICHCKLKRKKEDLLLWLHLHFLFLSPKFKTFISASSLVSSTFFLLYILVKFLYLPMLYIFLVYILLNFEYLFIRTISEDLSYSKIYISKLIKMKMKNMWLDSFSRTLLTKEKKKYTYMWNLVGVS